MSQDRPRTRQSLELPYEIAARHGATLLRFSLALVYIWFGTLKLVGASPVFALIGATLPWFDPHLTVPVLGGVELVLGVGLLVGRAPRLVLIVVLAHLFGTFLTFAVAPAWTFHGHDPLRLTADGEFVLKNLVLICAATMLLGHRDRA
jgi:putative oxidoreductase